MATPNVLTVAVAPRNSSLISGAIARAGGTIKEVSEAEALIWTDPLSTTGIGDLLRHGKRLRWIQLPSAGVDDVEPLLCSGHLWTSAKGAYAEPVAQHALALGLAGLGQFTRLARAREWQTRPETAPRPLSGSQITILGAGGVARQLLSLLAPFHTKVTIVRKNPSTVPGAHRVVGPSRLWDVLPNASLVFLTLALTPATEGIIGTEELKRMGPHSWLVNVARGAHIRTEPLLEALTKQTIGGAALDVTDPEPLPTNHPLWSLDNCLITPHIAITWDVAEPLLAERVHTNIQLYVRGEPLIGTVDVTHKY